MIGALPNWPAMMATDMACAYVSLGESSFQALAAANGVRPVDLGKLRGVRWKRSELDRLIDSLPAADEPSRVRADPSAPPSSDAQMAQQALSRVEHRSARRSAR